FIKIDVEGFEPFVLQGLRETLERSRPLVFFEWTQGVRKIVTGDCRKLFPENYSFYVFVPDTVLLGIFRKRHYKLHSVGGDWPDGNILALPVEFVNRLKTDLSTSDAALRLFAS
ncbi:FkbM family methyltransferase, partial [Litorivivens sp.]|uniref:FkbM family methyltransferase n=1 Tax=Litorivivens sp. TaxID=2020868 RepID=UPI003565BA60